MFISLGATLHDVFFLHSSVSYFCKSLFSNILLRATHRMWLFINNRCCGSFLQKHSSGRHSLNGLRNATVDMHLFINIDQGTTVCSQLLTVLSEFLFVYIYYDHFLWTRFSINRVVLLLEAFIMNIPLAATPTKWCLPNHGCLLLTKRNLYYWFCMPSLELDLLY